MIVRFLSHIFSMSKAEARIEPTISDVKGFDDCAIETSQLYCTNLASSCSLFDSFSIVDPPFLQHKIWIYMPLLMKNFYVR